jgi:putative hydrolase of the HAD superfamily
MAETGAARRAAKFPDRDVAVYDRDDNPSRVRFHAIRPDLPFWQGTDSVDELGGGVAFLIVVVAASANAGARLHHNRGEWQISRELVDLDQQLPRAFSRGPRSWAGRPRLESLSSPNRVSDAALGWGRSSVKQLEAIGFDLGDTLCEYAGVPLDWEREYPAALAGVAAGCGLDLSAERLRSGVQLLLHYNTRRTPRPEDNEYTATRIFQELIDGWGAPPEVLARCISSFFSHFRQRLCVFPDALAAISRLTKLRVPMAILTDVPYGMPKDLVLSDLALAGLSFPDDRVITSVDVGYRKPNPAGFEVLAQRLGVSCERLTYVGNERKDVVGGKGAGCHTVLLWRSDDTPPSWGQDLVIRSLAELPQPSTDDTDAERRAP